MVLAQSSADALSLEQLVQREVYGVSRVHERLIDAPASVTVITADEIRSFGYRTLAEALNGVRGTFVHSDRVYSYLGVRGFAPVGDFNTRVLLLIDGYRANDNVYDQAPLGTEGIIDIDLVERIEYIRGPGSLIYGSNAFFGVVNVITKSARSAGSGAWVGVGSGGARWGRASASIEPAPNTSLLLSATKLRSDGLDIVQPDLEARQPGSGRAPRADGEERSRLYAKLTAGNLRLSAGLSDRPKSIGFGVYGNDFNSPMSRVERESQRFIDARYEIEQRGQSVMARLYSGGYDYRDVELYGGVPVRALATGRWFGTELQWTRRIGERTRLLAGVEVQRDGRQDQRTAAEGEAEPRFDQRISGTRAGMYSRIDTFWDAQFASSIGLRLDRASDGEHTFNPRAALVWQPSAGSALKISAGSAFRSPNAYERVYQQGGNVSGASELQSERLRTVEVSYDAILDPVTRAAVSAYRYRASRLIVITSALAGGINLFRNAGAAIAYGVEGEVEHRLAPGLRLRGSLSWQLAKDDEGRPLPNSPHLTGRTDLAWDLTDTWRLGMEAIGVSARRTESAAFGSQLTANVTLSTAALVRGWDVGLSIYNIADRRSFDPVASLADLGAGAPIPQPGRTFFLRTGYRF